MESDQKNRTWTERLVFGTMLRGTLAVTPTFVTAVVVLGLVRSMPEDPGLIRGSVWLLAIAVAGVATATLSARFAARLLPLAALLKLSLAFPDRSPSRFRLAMKASSSRRLAREVKQARSNGLSSDANTAAEQILLLTTAVGEHDRKTRGHSERVRVLSRLIGEELGLGEQDLERLQWGALLHDIGKLSVPSQILNKSTSLSTTEWAILHGHPEAGRELIAPLDDFLGDFAGTADGHHEKWDGAGYPKGLAGKDIPLAARIVAVADAFEVMTSVRAYKKPMSAEAARAELTRCAGSHFDPRIVRALLNVSIGPLRWATGPVALAMGLPLIGKFIGLLARAGFHIGGTPAAAAAIAPATATAGAMSVVAVTGSIPMPTSLPFEASTIVEPFEVTTTVPLLHTFETTLPAPTTLAPTTTATSTTTAPTTTAAPSTTTAPTTTTAPSTTAAPTTTAPPTIAPSATAPSTTTAAPSTTGAPTTSTTQAPLSPLIKAIFGSPAQILGPVASGADLSATGPHVSSSSAFIFVDPVVTLTADLILGGQTIPSGSTVCPHLFLFNPSQDSFDMEWEIDFSQPILGFATTQAELEQTDFFSAAGVVFNQNREIENNDSVRSIAGSYNNRKLKLELGTRAGKTDSVRIFIACER